MNNQRLRTARVAAAEFKEKDPYTAVTENAIRTILRDKKIPTINFGNRIVFSLDDLEKYLDTGITVN